MSQIVTVTGVIMWRSKWDCGVWQPERCRMAEEWGGKKKKKWNDLWAGSIILSSVILPGLSSLFSLFTSPGFIIHPSSLCLPLCLQCVCCLTNLINCVWPTAQILVETHSLVSIHSSPIISPVSHCKTGTSNQITEKSNDQNFRKYL